MSLLSRLHDAIRPDPLQRRANVVVSTATTLGVGCYVPYATEYAEIYTVAPEHWDWVFTVAGVYVALVSLGNRSFSRSRKDRLMRPVEAAYVKRIRDARAAFADCRTMCERTMESLSEADFYKANPHLVAVDAIGRWMSWNAFGRAPSSEPEQVLARLMGSTCVQAFGGWWDDG